MQYRSLGFATLLSLSLGAGGCVAAVDDGPPDETDEDIEASLIDDYIWSLGTLPSDPPEVVEGEVSAEDREGDYSCTTQNLAETRQYDKIVAFAANSESLWPGAIVRGDSVYSGLFTQLVFDRDPLAVSISLSNLVGDKSAVMEQPSLSSFRDAIGDILAADVDGATPANLYAEIEEVHSQEQLSLAMGASVSWLGSAASISASFNFEQEEVRSRYVVKYTQGYYTVDIDQPSNPSSFLADTVTLDEVERKVGPGNPPVYVSSITYGRMVVFTFESEYSAEEMGAALEFVYSGGVDVSGDVSVTYKDIVSRSNITAYILGGSGGDAAQSIDSYDALMDFIKEGGDYSKESPGAPISYKLSYLRDNEPARLSFTEDYQIKTCERVSQKVKVTLKSITVEDAGGDDSNDLELFGSIWPSANNNSVMFDRDDDHYVVIRAGETWPQSNVIAETILDVVPREGSTISLGANLKDYDFWSPNDSMGNETVIAPFETGWRRDIPILLTGDDARVVVNFSIEPI
jgi:thiol-activated cytolysin